MSKCIEMFAINIENKKTKQNIISNIFTVFRAQSCLIVA